MFQKCSVNGMRVLLGDMNARLGKSRLGEEDITGERGWGREATKKVAIPNRDLVVQFCTDRSLMVANTMENAPPEQKVTFVEAGVGHMSAVSEATLNVLDLVLAERTEIAGVERVTEKLIYKQTTF